DRQHSGHARALRGADLAIGALGNGACGGTQRVLRGLATLLAGTFAWIHVRAQAAVRRVAQRALTRHLGVLHLAHEFGRAPARRRVVRVEALRDDPFEPLLFHRLEKGGAATDELLRPADRTHRCERLVEDLLALPKRSLRKVLAIGPEDVENLEHDGRALPEP